MKTEDILPVVFSSMVIILVAVWLAARAGVKLVPMILMSYGMWGVGAPILYVLRNTLGIR